MEKLNYTKIAASASYCDGVLDDAWKVAQINADSGKLTELDCPECKNRGFIAFLRDGSLCCRPCRCMAARKSIRQMEQTGLKEIIHKMTFDTFEAREPWQIKLKEGVEHYAQNATGWLLISGQSGCGKTHLCTAVCKKLITHGIPLHYMPWRETVAQLRAMSLDSDARKNLVDKLKSIPVLYIDDLYKSGRNQEGSTDPTAAEINLAFEIINHRYINRLQTIFSTERTPLELLRIDEATGSRIIELCDSHVYLIGQGKGKNYRLRNMVTL